MTKAENISVIICAYTERRWNELVAAVDSVQQQTLPASEIILVIDHNPQLLERAQKHFVNVVVVENTGARGLREARNCGVAIAKGKIIAFLDDDAQAAPDWLKFLCEGYSDSRVLGIGGAVEPLWPGSRPSWFPEEFYWVIGCTYHGVPERSVTIRNPIGANMSIRREVFETVGFFRDGLGRAGARLLGCEETELCIRTRQYWPDRIFLYQPRARVSHSVSRDRTRWRYFCSRCYAEGLSKAVVTRYVGLRDGLSSEYAYSLHTLPEGITKNVKAALYHHDLTGLLRSGAIVAGFTITTAGYCVGSIFSGIAQLRKMFSRQIIPGKRSLLAEQLLLPRRVGGYSDV